MDDGTFSEENPKNRPSITEKEIEILKKAALEKLWEPMQVGDELVVAGVPCKVVNLNKGKRRITFMPVDRLMAMPRG